jgi:5-formyltetrahydrofolate cyclo-ligase
MSKLPERRELRADLVQRRRELKPAERVAAAAGLRHSLEQLPEFLTDKHVAGYWATGGELPLNVAIGPLGDRGQTFYLPIVTKTAGKKRLTFAPWTTGEDVESNELGIPEPKAASHIIEFLRGQKRPAQPLLIGVGYSFQELPGIETAEWDIKLDYIATEKELIDCTEGAE